jgi:hypothetical protein
MRGTVLPPGQFSFHPIAALLGPPDWVQKKKDKKQTKCYSGKSIIRQATLRGKSSRVDVVSLGSKSSFGFESQFYNKN